MLHTKTIDLHVFDGRGFHKAVQMSESYMPSGNPPTLGVWGPVNKYQHQPSININLIKYQNNQISISISISINEVMHQSQK